MIFEPWPRLPSYICGITTEETNFFHPSLKPHAAETLFRKAWGSIIPPNTHLWDRNYMPDIVANNFGLQSYLSSFLVEQESHAGRVTLRTAFPSAYLQNRDVTPGEVGPSPHSELLCNDVELQSRVRDRPLKLFLRQMALFGIKYHKFLACGVVKNNGHLHIEQLRRCS